MINVELKLIRQLAPFVNLPYLPLRVIRLGVFPASFRLFAFAIIGGIVSADLSHGRFLLCFSIVQRNVFVLLNMARVFAVAGRLAGILMGIDIRCEIK